jgi:hypothetical protein
VNVTSAPAFRKSGRCGTSSCVEVAHFGGQVLVRDSKNPDQSALTFTMEEWQAFRLGMVEDGEFRFD